MHKFLFLICFSALFMACGGSGNTPDGVAKDFIMAMDSRDSSTAIALSTPESAIAIQLVLMTLPAANSKSAKHLQLDKLACDVKGDKATCTYCCDPNGRDQNVKLVRTNDKWLVTMQKDVPNFVPPSVGAEQGAINPDIEDEKASTDTLR
jgi:hypothetical protein